MFEVKVVTSYEGDWVEVHVGSDVIFQGHSVSPYDLREILAHVTASSDDTKVSLVELGPEE